MTELSPDRELIVAYAAGRSESAFRALLGRHVDMVFATALRQTGDAALAEEITQNVFVSLARKAPRLAGFETVGGWLFRATILETKARVRSELRRRQREETASEILTLQREGASPFAALLPLLDEALLDLRESERLALVLRFLENRSLREVGAALGVHEDAARKRVSRALEKVSEFFRKRGFAVSSAGGASALLSSTAQAAPPGIAVSAAASALAVGQASSGLNSFLLHLMKLTKTQMAAACLIVAVAPLVWQRFSQAALARDQSTVNAQIAEAAQRAASLESEAAEALNLANKARTDAANSGLQLDGLRAELANASVRPGYRWNDSSPYARLPKNMIGRMMASAAVQNRRGQLSDQIKQALQMTDGEIRETQAAATKFLSSYESLEARTMTEVPATDEDLRGNAADQTRVFDVPYIGSNAMSELRDDFFGQVTSTLGADRAEIFTNALAGWMPVTEDYNGISSGQAVYNSSLRMRFYQPSPGDKSIYYVVSTAQPSQCSGAISPDEVSPLYAPYLQDWLAALQSSSP